MKKVFEIIGEYTYDGGGKRIQVTENDVVTTYINFGLNVLYEENTTGTAAYIYGPTGRLAKRTTIDGEIYTFYYHTDHQGSTRLVTDESRIIVTDVTNEPFGEPIVTGSESYLYTGKEKDSTGLYYYGARYYDPDLGRFITRDLLEGKRAVPQSLNLYSYCLNNPVKMIDPTGLVSFCAGEGEEMVCIRFTQNGWFATKGQGSDATRITDSDEMERLMNGTEAEQARAAYLMLLITHPEIQGDPTQAGLLNEAMSGVSTESTWFDFKVGINGEEHTIHIGIDRRQYIFRQNGEVIYGEFVKVKNRDDTLTLELRLYQAAFSSVPTLFHVVGHEGAHLLDLLAWYAESEDPFFEQRYSRERTAYGWNFNFSNIFAFPFALRIPMVT